MCLATQDLCAHTVCSCWQHRPTACQSNKGMLSPVAALTSAVCQHVRVLVQHPLPTEARYRRILPKHTEAPEDRIRLLTRELLWPRLHGLRKASVAYYSGISTIELACVGISWLCTLMVCDWCADSRYALQSSTAAACKHPAMQTRQLQHERHICYKFCCCRRFILKHSEREANMQLARQCSSTAASAQGSRQAARPFTAAPRNRTGPRPHHCRALVVEAFATSSRSFSTAAAAAPRNAHSSRRTRRLVVRANWGAPVEFSTAKVVSNGHVAEKLHKVVVDVGELAAGYSKGGQFMQIKVTTAGAACALPSLCTPHTPKYRASSKAPRGLLGCGCVTRFLAGHSQHWCLWWQHTLSQRCCKREMLADWLHDLITLFIDGIPSFFTIPSPP
jgi:hypothetical protein